MNSSSSKGEFYFLFSISANFSSFSLLYFSISTNYICMLLLKPIYIARYLNHNWTVLRIRSNKMRHKEKLKLKCNGTWVRKGHANMY